MKIFDFFRKPEAKDASFETVLRLIAAAQGTLGGGVTPENCMRSPTVRAIVTAVSNRLAATPVHVYQTSMRNKREVKEKQPNHPIAQLLRQPNEWQSRYDYWQDAASSFVRHSKYIAKIGRGSTGPIRRLYPVNPSSVEIKQDPNTFALTFRYNGTQEWSFDKVHYVRGPARNFFSGDSTVSDISTSIGLEIAAEQFGATFFENGATPLMVFKYMQGAKGFKTPEDEKKFINDFQTMFSGSKRHRALLLPPGLESGDPVKIENDKAQFLQTRQHQRTVIAGAWGVPPQFVGDLSKGTYNNVEQQSEDFTLNVIMPITTAFEAAMERDFLTPADRNSGLKIRFNLDAELRAAFLDRQTGLKIQRENGVINANEWREIEGRPPRDDEGGEEYGTSVQTRNNDATNPTAKPSGAMQDESDPSDDQP